MCVNIRSSLSLGRQLRRRAKQKVLLCLHMVLATSAISTVRSKYPTGENGHCSGVRVGLHRASRSLHPLRRQSNHIPLGDSQSKRDHLGVPIVVKDQLLEALAEQAGISLRSRLPRQLGTLLLLQVANWGPVRLEDAIQET